MSVGFVGYGVLGRQLAELMGIPAGQRVIFDDPAHLNGDANAHGFRDYSREEFRHLPVFLGLGYRHLARKIALIEELDRSPQRLPSFVHPTCHVSHSARIGCGTVVFPLCNIDIDVDVAMGCLLNNSVTLSHDVSVGDGSFLSHGVIVCGFARIGRGVFVGAGSIISNGVRIGDYAQIGVGTVVTKDVPPGESVIGNPMRFLTHPLKLI